MKPIGARILGRGLLAAVLATWLASPALADTRKLEAVGAAPIDAETQDEDAARTAAVRWGVSEAVARVAGEMLRLDPSEADAAIASALGRDPFAYASRYRVIEDRGRRPAIFTRQEGVEDEYVVVVEVHVDVERVKGRLARAGHRVPSGDSRRYQTRLVVDGLESYESFAVLRRTLVERVGCRSAVPVELERGRAVLAVESSRSGRALLDALVAGAEPGLRVTPLRTEGDTLYIRISFTPPPPPPPPPVGAAPRARSGRN